ncbi:MAG: hypothetical protein Kow0047_20530 [Anaerolineae bacterium]
MRPTLSLLMVSCLFILVSCAAPLQTASAPAPAAESAARPAPEWASSEPLGGALVERMITREATVGLVVDDVLSAIDQVATIAQSFDGYIVSSNVYRVDGQFRGNAVIRVPAESLEETLRQLHQLAVRVDYENLTSRDVTEEYTDNASRLRNLEATEQELLALMRDIRSRPNATAEDILSVHRRITEVRDEIERLKGRQQLLENQVALSTVTIDLMPDELAGPVVAGRWRPLATVRSAFRTLVSALQRLVELGIWVVIVVIPLGAIVLTPFVALYALIRAIQRRRAR